MKYFIVFILVASCFFNSYCIAVKNYRDTLMKITEVKKEVISGTNNIINNGKTAIKDLKDFAVLKRETLVGSVKVGAKTKLGLIGNIKAAKASLATLKSVAAVKYAKFAAIQAAKSAFVNNYLNTKKTHLKQFTTMSSKSKGLSEHKLPIKGMVTTLFSGTVGKVQNKLVKKKANLALIKNPTNADNALLFPSSTQHSTKLYTYINNKTHIVGKIFVQKLLVRTIEKPQVQLVNKQLNYSYGLPAETYGPPITAT